jgi:hypothetical protein
MDYFLDEVQVSVFLQPAQQVLQVLQVLQVHSQLELVALVLLRVMLSMHRDQRRALLLIQRQVRDQPLPSSSQRSSWLLPS